MEPGFPYCHVAKDWRADYEGESDEQITKLFDRTSPARAAGGSDSMRTFEVTDRFAVPSIAPAHGAPAYPAQSYTAPIPRSHGSVVSELEQHAAHLQRAQARAEARAEARRPKRFGKPAIGMAVGAVCVLVGIGIGGAIAASGPTVGTAAAAPAQPAPVVEMHRSPVPNVQTMTVTPIEPAAGHSAPAPVPAPAPAPVPAAAPDPAPAPAAAAVVIVAPPTHAHHRHPRGTTALAAAEAPPPASGATGKLAISSKPPCAIQIDGRDTGLTAPQQAISLAPGRHTITLSNAEQGIQLTTEVAITADHTSQLIRDFTK